MCIFCDKIKELPSNLKTSYWAIIEDKYPVNKGHLLIVPKRHIATTDELTANEWYELQSVLAAAKKLINDEEIQKDIFGKIITTEDTYPDGFNIGINEGEAAGQTINHLHIHVIPRYLGDVEDPTGGVRGVIPNKQKYK
jgi:diadenosine tetraphosphate (Ap4A) HIT family hydrolase